MRGPVPPVAANAPASRGPRANGRTRSLDISTVFARFWGGAHGFWAAIFDSAGSGGAIPIGLGGVSSDLGFRQGTEVFQQRALVGADAARKRIGQHVARKGHALAGNAYAF